MGAAVHADLLRGTQPVNAPARNRLSTAHGQAVTLDAAGNTVQARGLSFQWNAAGQLQSVSKAGMVLATYAYDHRWLRVRKTTSAGTVHYHHDQEGHLIAETTGSGQASKSYVWLGNLPLAVIEHGQPGERILYLEADHLNTPIAARDQSGRTVWRWDSDAFGSVQPIQDPDADGQNTIINLRFPGQYYDVETGLHQNWHRTYDPLTGRYISSDPIGLAGGWNGFAYGNGNPLRFTDPSGLNPLGGAVIGAELGTALLPGPGTLIGAGVGLVGGYLIADRFGNLIFAKPPPDAYDPTGPKAPGRPGETEGYCPPKGGDDWARNPNGRGHGWRDKGGNVWVPTGLGGEAHGGPHWDVQVPGGGYVNVYPGGTRRP